MAQRVSDIALASVAALGGERLVREAGVVADEVWAVGKAAVAMARGSGIRRGIVITKQAEPVDGCEVYEAAHPIPDERGVAATRRLLERAREVDPSTRVLLCLSGGASALLAAPVDAVPLSTVQEATRALMRAGAPIDEINTVRRHLGAALGGKLAAATRAKLEVLALSDVVGNDPAAIGSGPASPDRTTLADALEIARRRGLSEDVVRALVQETPKSLDNVRYRILATPLSLREEAARQARGWRVRVRDELVRGDVEDLAREITQLELAPGELWIAVGEPTVRVRGDGVGGRAQHLALLVAKELAADRAFVALGSDGSDGPTPAAGAFVDGDTWRRALAAGLDPDAALARFDSHTLLAAVGATVVTGTTGTNLTDLFLLGRALTTPA